MFAIFSPAMWPDVKKCLKCLKGFAFQKRQTAKQPSSKNTSTQNRPIAYGQEKYVKISQALNRRHRTRMNNHDSMTCNCHELARNGPFHLMPIGLQFQAARTVCVCSGARQVTRYDPWVSGVSQGVNGLKCSEMFRAGPRTLTCLCALKPSYGYVVVDTVQDACR